MVVSMNFKASYNQQSQEIELADNYKPAMTLTQLQCLVRQANVEYGLNPNKPFSYHLFENIYLFNRKEAINFLMVGVGDVFFDASRDLILSLVGKYFLGDFTKKVNFCGN